MTDEPYPPIRDLVLIGDCHGAALISRQGSVDWCCLGRFDADPIFCRLLDADRGGFFSLAPEEESSATRSYLDETNILQTTLTTASGVVTVTDFMPVGRKPGSSIHDYVHLNAPCQLVRIVECTRGAVTLRVRYRPSIAFARRPARLELAAHGVAAEGGPFLQSSIPLSLNGDLAEGMLPLSAGERREFIVSQGSLAEPLSSGRVQELLEVTHAFWQEWIEYCRYRGPYSATVRRSALVLKALTYATSGAIVAAPTTSLPDEFGGARNWDYRYCWPRDVALTLYALSSLGYSGEAGRFAEFLYGVCRHTDPHVQFLYGIEGETEPAEQTLDHLEGYRGSQPVRIGNGAYDQRQLDVYGEILDWAHLHGTLGGKFTQDSLDLLASITAYVSREWREPDQGIWEMRGAPRQYTFGKIMSWVTIDRAIRMFGDSDGRGETREAIRKSVLAEGIIDQALVQVFGDDQMDASLLLAPLVAFPADHHVLETTANEIQKRLGEGDYLLRYRNDDGLPGSDAAFLVCSFWMVDALLVLGHPERARRLYERLLRCANDLGLYSEQIDSTDHELLGNFPQALTHLGMIQCAVNFWIYEEHGLEALQGTHADRARVHVEATAGLRGLWAAFKKSGRVGRLRSSRASMLVLDKNEPSA